MADQNFHNIRNLFNNVEAKHAEQDAPSVKKTAKAIYESVEAKGSIIAGVKGVEKKLSEQYAKMSEWGGGDPDGRPGQYSKAQGQRDSDDYTDDDVADAEGDYDENDDVMEQNSGRLVGKLGTNELNAKIYKNELGEFQVKYFENGQYCGEDCDSFEADLDDARGTASAELKFMSSRDNAQDPHDVGDLAPMEEDRYNIAQIGMKKPGMKEGETVTTSKGKIHKGDYGASYTDNDSHDGAAKGNPDGKRGKGRPKKAGYDERMAKIAANKAAGVGRGRPKKTATTGDASKPDWSAFGGKVKLPAWKGGVTKVKGHDTKDTGNAKRHTKVDEILQPTHQPTDELVRGEMKNMGAKIAQLNQMYAKAKATNNIAAMTKIKQALAMMAKGQQSMSSNVGMGTLAEGEIKSLKSYLQESIKLESSHNLEDIVRKFKFETKAFLMGDEMDQDLHDALFDYYCDNGEMPYGVAKARTGDPYEWVSNKFGKDVRGVVGVDPGQQQMEETPVNPIDVPAVQRKAMGQGSLTLDQVRAPRADSISDTSNLNVANGNSPAPGTADAELAKLRELAGMAPTMESTDLSEDMSVIGSNLMTGAAAMDADGMSINTNYNSRDGKKSVSITADGEAAEQLLQMLKIAGMGSGEAAQKAQATITVAQGTSPEASPEVDCGDSTAEVVDEKQEYANEPKKEYGTVDQQMRQGNDMNREKQQHPNAAAKGDNPMVREADDIDAMGRKLMQQYQSLKIKK